MCARRHRHRVRLALSFLNTARKRTALSQHASPLGGIANESTASGETALTVLAFDFGLKHIGIATVEPRVGTASGLTQVRAKDGQPHWDAMDQVFSEWRPERAVVGLPLNMDGSESDMCIPARRFGRRIAARYGIDVEFADERLSTFEAVSEGADKDASHAAAACVIAETWLSSQGNR